MFRTKDVDLIKTLILCSITFVPQNRAVYEMVETYCTAGQTTDENVAHAHGMLDTKATNTHSQFE